MDSKLVNKGLERALLGALLVEPEQLAVARAEVQDVDFFFEAHRKIFGRMCAMADLGQPVDLLLLIGSFKADNTIREVGGEAGLSALLSDDVASWNAAEYAAQIHQLSCRRQARACLLDESEAVASTDDVASAIGTVISRLEGIQQKATAQVQETMNAIAAGAYHDVQRMVDGEEIGWSSGFEGIDEGWGLLQPTLLYYLYAASSMGKTALMANIAGNLAMGRGANQGPVPITIWSGEMNKKRWLLRIATAAAGVNLRELKTWRGPGGHPLERGEIEYRLGRLREFLEETTQWNHVQILDDSSMTPLQLKAHIQRHHGEHGPGVLIADYLQLLKPDERCSSRELEISTASKALLGIAKSEGVAVLCAGQVNNNMMDRQNKRPTQKDLRYSGAPYHDSDGFAFLHREVYYEAREKGCKEHQLPGHRQAEFIVIKNRDGELGTVPLDFYGEYGRFEDRRH